MHHSFFRGQMKSKANLTTLHVWKSSRSVTVEADMQTLVTFDELHVVLIEKYDVRGRSMVRDERDRTLTAEDMTKMFDLGTFLAKHREGHGCILITRSVSLQLSRAL